MYPKCLPIQEVFPYKACFCLVSAQLFKKNSVIHSADKEHAYGTNGHTALTVTQHSNALSE